VGREPHTGAARPDLDGGRCGGMAIGVLEAVRAGLARAAARSAGLVADRSLRARLLRLLLAVGLGPTLALGAVGLRVLGHLRAAATAAGAQVLQAKAASDLEAAVQEAAQRLGGQLLPAEQQAFVLATQARYILSNPGLFPGDQQGNTPFFAMPDGDLVNKDPTVGVFAPAAAVSSPGFWEDVRLLSHIDPLLRSLVAARCCVPPPVRYWIQTPAGLIRADPNPGFDAAVRMRPQSELLNYFAGQPPAALPAWQWGLWTLPYPDPAGAYSADRDAPLLVSAVVPIYTDAGTFRGLAGADVSVAVLGQAVGALVRPPFRSAVLYRPVAGPSPGPPQPYPPADPGRPLDAVTIAATVGAPDPAQFGVPSGTAGTRLVGRGAGALLVAYAPVGVGGWMLAEAAPASAAASQAQVATLARRTARSETGAAALLAAVTLALAAALVLLARRAAAGVAEPLRRLAAEMRALGAAGGEEGGEIPAGGGADEVAVLTAEFAALTRRLELATERWRREAEERARAELAVLREKQRIAREVHDTLAQTLLAIVLLAEGGRGRWTQVAELARQGLRHARQAMAELASDGAGPQAAPLLEAVRAEVASFAASLPDPVEVVVDAAAWPEPALPLPVQVALLGVLRSALGNVREHAGAARVRVTLRAAEDAAVLEVADDGRGFDPAELARRSRDTGRGLGLPGMRQRLAEVGGVLCLESRPGHGTVVRAIVPLAAGGAERGPRTARGEEEGTVCPVPPSAS
jgi:signal transduction histidine kinase